MRKGDEGLPYVPPSQRKPGTGDEGLPLKKGGKGMGDEGRPIKKSGGAGSTKRGPQPNRMRTKPNRGGKGG